MATAVLHRSCHHGAYLLEYAEVTSIKCTAADDWLTLPGSERYGTVEVELQSTAMQGEIFFPKAAISSGNNFAILGALGKVLSSCVLKQWSRVGEDFEQHQGKKLVILKNIHPCRHDNKMLPGQ